MIKGKILEADYHLKMKMYVVEDYIAEMKEIW